MRAGRWTLVLSNTVCAEYEEILKRQAPILGIALEEIDHFRNGLCLLAERRTLATTWTPILHDPDDEDGTNGLMKAVEIATDVGVPYGLAPATWKAVVDRATDLRERLNAADEEQIVVSATELRSLLRPYV